MKKNVLAVVSCAQLSLFCLTTEANDDVTIEEVLVTSAQKRSEDINSVPIAIEVYDKTFIENAGAAGLSELEFAIPSVNFGRGGRKTRGEIAIRGIGDFSRNIGTDARVAVYIDDVPLGRSSAFNVSLLDIKQIEVLKGPQGTLFGTNTVAGAINIITNDPGDTVNNELRADLGNRNHRLFSLKSNLPFSNNFAGTLQVSRHKSDGFLKNITLNSLLQGDNVESARLKLRYSPSGSFSVATNFDWLAENINATNAEALADGGRINSIGFSAAPSPRQVAHDSEEFEDREIWGGSLIVEYELRSGSALKSISAYRNSSFEELSEEDYSPTPIATSTFDEKYDQWTQELQFVSRKHERIDYVVGAFFSLQETTTERSATLIGGTTVTPGKLKSQLSSLYTNGNYQFSPRLEINLGFRLQTEKKDLDYAIDDGIGLFVTGSIDEDESFSSFLPKLSFNFNLESDALLYTSISRGTKGGGWNADFVTSLDDLYFEPEYSTNYEIGYRDRFFEEQLNLNLTAFMAKFTDFQVFQFVNGTTQLTNAGEATSQGLELSVSADLNRFITLSFNSAITKAEFDQFRDGNEQGIDYDGNKLPYAPEFTAYTSVNSSFPITDGSEVFYYFDYSYSDGYFSNPSNESSYEIDEFYTVNGRIGLTINSHWKISVWGKNLTDETSLRSRDVSILEIERGYYEAPRSYGVSFIFSQK